MLFFASFSETQPSNVTFIEIVKTAFSVLIVKFLFMLIVVVGGIVVVMIVVCVCDEDGETEENELLSVVG